MNFRKNLFFKIVAIFFCCSCAKGQYAEKPYHWEYEEDFYWLHDGLYFPYSQGHRGGHHGGHHGGGHHHGGGGHGRHIALDFE